MSSFNPQTASALHTLLRQASKQAHHSLDHHPLLAPLLKPELGAEQYGNVLAALHGVHAAAESLIHTYLDQHPDLSYRPHRRLSLLEADLAALNRDPYTIPFEFPPPQSIAALIGILYTIEGSNMGGQVIARTIREMGSSHLPMQFFDGSGDLALQRWQAFLVFADTYCPPDQYEVAAATAFDLFEVIRQHLDRVGEVVSY